MARNKRRNGLQNVVRPRHVGPEIDKLQVLATGVSKVNDLFDEVLKPASGGRNLTEVLRAIMNPKHLAVYDLALRCETEMLKCEGVEAYLAGCLMGAAMNEAILSLLCLFYEAEVIQTNHYKNATQRESYEAMVGIWKFEHLIRVAEELSWIPDDVVSNKVIVALIEIYKELMPVSKPDLSQAEIDAGAAEFDLNPGIAMLRLIQELRNSIHSGQWIRGRRVLDATHFDSWCQIAMRVSGEIRNCLFHRLTTTTLPQLNEAVEKYNEQVDNLRAIIQKQGRDPRETDELLEKMMSDILRKSMVN